MDIYSMRSVLLVGAMLLAAASCNALEDLDAIEVESGDEIGEGEGEGEDEIIQSDCLGIALCMIDQCGGEEICALRCIADGSDESRIAALQLAQCGRDYCIDAIAESEDAAIDCLDLHCQPEMEECLAN